MLLGLLSALLLLGAILLNFLFITIVFLLLLLLGVVVLLRGLSMVVGTAVRFLLGFLPGFLLLAFFGRLVLFWFFLFGFVLGFVFIRFLRVGWRADKKQGKRGAEKKLHWCLRVTREFVTMDLLSGANLLCGFLAGSGEDVHF